MTNLGNLENGPGIAGSKSIIPKEHENFFVNLPIIRFNEKDTSAIAVWDSSMHDSPYLNRVTSADERVYMILKTTVRLSHPSVIDVVLRKRLVLNVYKKQSFSQMFLKKIVPSEFINAAGVTYEIVSHIPKALEDIEDRESLALLAANCNDNENTTEDGESYIDKYMKGVSAVWSILALDQLRQQVAVRELSLKAASNKQHNQANESNMRKTASVPNMELLVGSIQNINGSSKLDRRSDSAFDIALISSYDGITRLKHYLQGTASNSSVNNDGHVRGSLVTGVGNLSESSLITRPSVPGK